MEKVWDGTDGTCLWCGDRKYEPDGSFDAEKHVECIGRKYVEEGLISYGTMTMAEIGAESDWVFRTLARKYARDGTPDRRASSGLQRPRQFSAADAR